MEKFKIESNGSDFDLVGIADAWHIKGFSVRKRSNRLYVSGPKDQDKGRLVSKAHFFQRLYNWWNEPTPEDLRRNWAKMLPSKILEAANINDEFIRQLYLDTIWK